MYLKSKVMFDTVGLASIIEHKQEGKIVEILIRDAPIHYFPASLSTNKLSGPILNNKSTILRFGRKPCLASNTW